MIGQCALVAASFIKTNPSSVSGRGSDDVDVNVDVNVDVLAVVHVVLEVCITKYPKNFNDLWKEKRLVFSLQDY